MPPASRGRKAPPFTLSAFDIQSAYTGLPVPDIIEFVTSDKYLNKPQLYPRQATILKTIFLQTELFTDYDYEVLDEWAQAFENTSNNGINPDIFERIELLRADGWPYFHEVVAAIGRRGSKGHLGALCGSYVLWNFLAKPLGPQTYYGIDKSKQLVAAVFAGKKDQAKENQWRDFYNVVVGGPCFKPYLANTLGESLTVYAPIDKLNINEMAEKGIDPGIDTATFRISPLPSTLQAGRGPTSFIQLYDEMAHVIASGANRSAGEVYEAAKPALDQFRKDGFLYEPSSTWQKTGKFYENYERGLAKTEDGLPADPQMLVIQLASWDPYKDYEQWRTIPLVPGQLNKQITVIPLSDTPARKQEISYLSVHEQRRFIPLMSAPQIYDEQMRKEQNANPETFAIERLSHFATVQDAYLRPDYIARMFAPYEGRVFRMEEKGKLAVMYKGHGDPSKSGANFGLAIAHTEIFWEERIDPSTGEMAHMPVMHCVFDKLHAWRPKDFPDNQLDYIQIENELFDFLVAFMPSEFTFDQFNSVSPIAHLNMRVREYGGGKGLPKRVICREETATASRNWERAETFKTALGMNWLHAPWDDENGHVYEASELAFDELTYLQENNGKVVKQEVGPVQTKDVADCMMECVHHLLGQQVTTFLGQSLGKQMPRAGLAGGAPLQTELVTEGTEGHSLARNPRADRMSELVRSRADAARGGRFDRTNRRIPSRSGRISRGRG